MRSLKKFIAESVHTYDYTIKVAGDVDKNFLELFKYNLDKFSPVDIKGPKSKRSIWISKFKQRTRSYFHM
jgi:hypothetical protein